MDPCESCKKNNQPNCGNEYCHTRSDDVKDWVIDCGSCNEKTFTHGYKTLEKISEDGCPVCGSDEVEIYRAEEE